MMPATKAADCGVSSNLCRRSYRNGIPPSMYSIVQEMGRVDRNPSTDTNGGDEILNKYEVHISFMCLVKLYARIMQHPEKTERQFDARGSWFARCAKGVSACSHGEVFRRSCLNTDICPMCNEMCLLHQAYRTANWSHSSAETNQLVDLFLLSGYYRDSRVVDRTLKGE